MDRLKIAVVGAGAVGGLLAWRLAQAGHAVSIIARGEHLRAIQASGLRLIEGADETIGERGVPNRIAIAATADPGDSTTTGGVQDLVVTGLKAHALPAVLSALGPMLGPATRVIPALNGVPFWYFDGPATLRTVDPEGLAASSLAPGRVIGCVVHLAAEVVAPGVIRHTGGQRLIFGEALAGADLPTDARWSVHQVVETFRSAGFAAEHSSDIRREVWTKLIGNLSFNPVAAITGLRMDALCADPAICALLRLLDQLLVRLGAEAHEDEAHAVANDGEGDDLAVDHDGDAFQRLPARLCDHGAEAADRGGRRARARLRGLGFGGDLVDRRGGRRDRLGDRGLKQHRLRRQHQSHH